MEQGAHRRGTNRLAYLLTGLADLPPSLKTCDTLVLFSHDSGIRSHLRRRTDASGASGVRG